MKGPRLLIGSVLAALLVGAVAFGWRWYTAPAPPEVSLANAVPAAVAAVQAAQEDVRRQPRSAAAWGKLAMVLTALEYNEEAVVCYAQAERLDPADPRWPYLHGVHYLAGSPCRAVPLLQRALSLALTPEQQTTIRFRLALVLIEDGQLAEAAEQTETLRRLEPDSPRVHFAFGLLGIARQDWSAARDSLVLVADSPFARQKACTLLATLPDGDRKRARAYQQRAEGFPKDYPWPDPFEAELRTYRLDRMSRIAQFTELKRQGQLPEAVAFLRQFVASAPDAEVTAILGYTLCDMNELEEAVAVLRTTTQIDPRNVRAHYFLGTALLRLGEKAHGQPGAKEPALTLLRQAVAAADQAIALQSDHGYAHLTRGKALRLLGRTDEGLRALRQALLCRPEFADMHLALGEALAEARLPEAREHLENAVRLAPPDDPRPREALEKWNARVSGNNYRG